MNPAFDLHFRAESFSAFSENAVSFDLKSAGGKGLNVSRALLSAGIKSTALLVIGNENGSEFLASIPGDIELVCFSVPGRIRENITIHSDGEKETRISPEGFPVDAKTVTRVGETLLSGLDFGDYLIVGGKLPRGLSASALMPALEELRDRGVHIAIDSKSFTLSDILALRPWLIKPNEEELRSYFPSSSGDIGETISLAAELAENGIENVLLTLGKRGAFLASQNSCLAASAPKVDPISSVGAGDSSLAGFISAKIKGLSEKEALTYAMAFGAAACKTAETASPDFETACELLPDVRIMEY